ncbi:hypothetical protein ACFZAC_02940 [Pseudomonas fluorescens]|uniref:hypothetical protein n=1 Tax=Pseudomonas fluorescens TaxID=294 RepID=UPI00374A1D39
MSDPTSKGITKSTIITAVLTGLITVVGSLLTYWVTNSKPELIYTLNGGPSLKTNEGAKRIYVVEVKNSGEKEISQAFIHLSLATGVFSETASQASPGVKINEEKSERQIELRADSLNPNDTISISFITIQTAISSDPEIAVRAKGVNAKNQTQKDKEDPWDKYSAIFALIAAFAVFISNYIISFFRKIGFIKETTSSLKQAPLCAYICETCNLSEEAIHFRFAASKLTYRTMADHLKHRGTIANDRDKIRYSTALRAMLLIANINTYSLELIRHAIAELDGVAFNDEEYNGIRSLSSDEGEDPKKWRGVISTYVKNRMRISTAPL